MDLRDDIPTNLADLATWLRQVFAKADQPAPAVWEEMRQGGLDRADYLQGFVIDRVERPTRYLVLEKFEAPSAQVRTPELISTVAGLNGEHAQRPATDPEEDEDDRLSVRGA
jgi:hypothetical protein